MTQAQPAPASTRAAFAHLAALAARPGGTRITPLFAADPARAERFAAHLDDLTLDFSKSSIDDSALDALFDLAAAADLEGFRARLFAGEMVNVTERRAALHMALRAPAGAAMRAQLPGGSEDAAALSAHERDRMRAFVEAVHSGRVVGATGRRFATVVTVGIGGSDLGPRVATEALSIGRSDTPMQARFLSNVDGHAFADTVKDLDPATTLVLIASKTFTTQETMMNAAAMRGWIADALGEGAVAHHFAALSTNLSAVAAFGIASERVFGFRDWVGGRYSLWSAVGLSCAIALGWDVFQAFLDGGAAMDAHFLEAPLERNAPVLLGMAQVFNRNGMGRRARAVIPYSQRLRFLAPFLQQLEMESNGKRVSATGKPLENMTAPVVFGDPGTNAQHAFFQMLHQGTDVIPLEFIGVAENPEGPPGGHAKLLSNLLAQAEALMIGRSEDDVREELVAKGLDPAAIDELAPQRTFPGNRPSSLIVMDALTPHALGALIALYEHKTFVEGVVWGINSFDQWGVELGKVMANRILPELQGGPRAAHDPSTSAWIERLKRKK